MNEMIRTGIFSLGSELHNVNALLQDADIATGDHNNNQVRIWVQQLQDVAYDIKDILDVFAFHVAEDEKNVNWYTKLWDTQLACANCNIRSISKLIDDIKSKRQLIGETKERYGHIVSSQASGSSSSTTARNYSTLHPRIAPLFMDETDVVGFEESINKLTSWALRGRDRCEVMFVVGMGGSGKTTLVNKAYQRVKGDFDCHAWITASKSKKKADLLLSMFNQFDNAVAEPALTNEVELMHQLRDYLHGKRYIIVLDDLWIKDVWESIRCALPRMENRGRVIITTRRGDIAYSCRDNFTCI